LNALANRVTTGGYENTRDYYKGCEIVFCDIENIHAVRESITKVYELGLSNQSNSKWFTQLDNTNWLQLSSKILSAANNIVETITVKNINVLVHCTDGWDRTA
jgi:protein tyrosine phosphatase